MKLKILSIPFLKLIVLYLILGILSRVVFFFHPITSGYFSALDFSKIFFIGMLNDVLVFIIAYLFFWLYLLFLSENKFRSPWGGIIFILLVLLTVYVSFFKTVLNEYGGGVSKIVSIFLAIKTLCFAVLLFFPSVRKNFRYYMTGFVYFLFVFLMLYNTISEYLFWNEFGVRYNFIAVDYLIYTNEVIGNIMESYPIIPLLSMLFLVSLILTVLLVKKSKNLFVEFPTFKQKLISSVVYFLLIIGAVFGLKETAKWETSDNPFIDELQSNGLYKFYYAFENSELDYNKYYAKIPDKEAFSIINKQYGTQGNDIKKIIQDTIPEKRMNVVLITMESMSGEFLSHLGGKNNLTPNLDKLANEGIFFSRLYATGNRTVRGLEAVTLCIPPMPGESIVKRKDNSNLYSTGSIFKSRGYTVQFLYGGDSYFDNMKTFFSGNGYSIVDKSSFNKDEITFKNIWGVCDEDMYNKALKIFNKNASLGKPFFSHIMTVSNHRPFTYPAGKIDIPPDIKSRDGGVKYTDYALGQFINKAKRQSWFKNTVFVIVADHCASSAGKTDIPVEKYHIPAIIYSPGNIKAQQNNTIVSQIDLMPTVFGLLHFNYESHFYGQNIFSPSYKSRAFLATYQNLAYYQNNILTILSPKQKIEQFIVDSNGNETILNKKASLSVKEKEEAIANYQTTNYLIKNNKLKK